MLQLGRLIGLGVDVGDLLQLLRALARHRPAADAADEEHVLGRGEPARDLGDLLLGGQDLLDLPGQRAHPGHDPLAGGRGHITNPAEQQREQGERGRHVGQRLGGGDRDLRRTPGRWRCRPR